MKSKMLIIANPAAGAGSDLVKTLNMPVKIEGAVSPQAEKKTEFNLNMPVKIEGAVSEYYFKVNPKALKVMIP